jgi:hypothetical protein
MTGPRNKPQWLIHVVFVGLALVWLALSVSMVVWHFTGRPAP